MARFAYPVSDLGQCGRAHFQTSSLSTILPCLFCVILRVIVEAMIGMSIMPILWLPDHIMHKNQIINKPSLIFCIPDLQI